MCHVFFISKIRFGLWWKTILRCDILWSSTLKCQVSSVIVGFYDYFERINFEIGLSLSENKDKHAFWKKIYILYLLTFAYFVMKTYNLHKIQVLQKISIVTIFGVSCICTNRLCIKLRHILDIL